LLHGVEILTKHDMRKNLIAWDISVS
jgi:hypothetical protein